MSGYISSNGRCKLTVFLSCGLAVSFCVRTCVIALSLAISGYFTCECTCSVRMSRLGYGKRCFPSISLHATRSLTTAPSLCFIGSVDFYNQHKIAANNPSQATRVKTAPAQRTSPSKQTSPQAHWLTWNSGTPEPPGLQKRLHRPYPTPEPPKMAEPSRCSSRNSRSNSVVPRPVSGTLLPTNPTKPVPDMIGSEGVDPTLTKAREPAFSPKPETLPANQLASKSASHPLAYFM